MKTEEKKTEEKKAETKKSEEKTKLFLIDDDAVFLKSLEIEFLENVDFDIQTYQTGELALAKLKEINPDIVILDYHLDSIDLDAMNGIEVLDKIKEHNPDTPVIMLSSQDDINVAINCMHHKALDYVVKSETAFLRLQKIITSIFKMKKMAKQLNWYMDRL
ncbi:MAG: response regulator [Bacteroidetes bacterium]|nr:response regulator [Bacteroidota bacterium]